MITKGSGGYYVKSEHKTIKGKRKSLGGPYKSRAAAKKRLRQVEMFKHMRRK